MMRSRLAARSTRLALAAAAVTALAVTTTACESQDTADTGSTAAPAATASSSSGGGKASSGGGQSAGDTASTGDAGNADSGDQAAAGSGSDNGSDNGTGTDTGTDTGTGDGGTGDKSGYGQACGTNDLDLSVSWETAPDVDGYYRVTAKAKSGITCYLDVNTPSVAFGSGADGVASPVGQGGEDPIKLTGSAVAYTGIDAKTTDGDAGKQFDHVIVSVTDDDPNPAELELPDMATVDKPIVTNWSTVADETVPRIV